MIRYTPYKEFDDNEEEKTPFQIYQEAVNRSDDPKKTTLQVFEHTVLSHYQEYGGHYNTETVHNICTHGIKNPEAAMLKSLYSSKSAIIRRVKNYFNNDLPNRIYLNTCPYCGLPGAGTTEHILPKEDYPEYAIHTLNLLPCCNICNSGKGKKVKDNLGNPEFINFFYHDIESIQFLEADVSLDTKGKPKFIFYLNFCPDFDLSLRHTIENHYKNLNLLTRYGSLADSKYAECEVAISTLAAGNPDITKALSDYLNRVEMAYGKNHYYSAMIRSMAGSSEYLRYLSAII